MMTFGRTARLSRLVLVAVSPLWLPACIEAQDADADELEAADGARGEWTPSGKADEVASCIGACGDQAAAGCWCDDRCAEFGDCCPDRETECGGGPQADDGGAGTSNCSLPTDGAWSCDGLTGSTTNPDHIYFATSFGCWVDAQGVAHSDGDDNCLPACSLASIGCSGKTGPQCERAINWYAADSDRFGCGTKLQVTNADNGKSAVVMVIDRGPNCRIERKVDHWVLDVSNRASRHLFGGETSATERAAMVVSIVDDGTPLGPTTAANVCG